MENDRQDGNKRQRLQRGRGRAQVQARGDPARHLYPHRQRPRAGEGREL